MPGGPLVVLGALHATIESSQHKSFELWQSRKYYVSKRLVSAWNSLPDESVSARTVDIFAIII
jgi:hypothetical protein